MAVGRYAVETREGVSGTREQTTIELANFAANNTGALRTSRHRVAARATEPLP